MVAEVPLLASANSDSLQNIEGYYYFAPEKDYEPPPKIAFEITKSDGKNKYQLSYGDPMNHQVLMYKIINKDWLLQQAQSSNSEENSFSFQILKIEADGFGIFMCSKNCSLRLDNFPNLIGRVTKNKGIGNSLMVDKVAITKYKGDILAYIKKVFIEDENNLSRLGKMVKTGKETVYANWCTLLAKHIYNEQALSEKGNQKNLIKYAVKTCKQAVNLNLQSIELKHSYGKTLQKAGDSMDAKEWLDAR
jgi:hypothetical protein